MSLSRYPKYKDSGVEWLGEVPEHWKIQPLLGIALERNESNHGMLEDNLLSLSYGRIVQKDIDSNDGLLPESFETYQIIHPGDIVFRLTDLQNDKRSLRTAIVEERGIITSAYLAVVPRKLQASFLSHLLRAYDMTKVFYSMGGGLRQSMKFADVKRLPILCPPPEEQVAITAFLERETGKIDALVEEQRRLIELLKEKRQAVISHAVTKGLNPNAPMKDSGIDWLGQIPSHWDVKPLKQLAKKITDGEHISPAVTDDGVPLLSAKDVRDWKVDYDVEKFVSVDDARVFWKRCRPEQGDVLVVSRGATVGRIGVVEDTTEFCLMGSVILCKPDENYDPALLYYALNAKHAQTSLWFSSASSAQQAIYIRDVAYVPIPIPPFSERAEIVAFLNNEVVRLDALAAQATHGIDLFQERRTALISAAVTGKIDVRGLVAGNAA